MRNNFCYPLKMDSNTGLFSIAPDLVIALSTLLKQKLSLNYAVKALSKSNGNLFTIAFKSEKERQL